MLGPGAGAISRGIGSVVRREVGGELLELVADHALDLFEGFATTDEVGWGSSRAARTLLICGHGQDVCGQQRSAQSARSRMRAHARRGARCACADPIPKKHLHHSSISKHARRLPVTHPHAIKHDCSLEQSTASVCE